MHHAPLILLIVFPLELHPDWWVWRVAFVVNAPDTAENSNNQDLWLADLGHSQVFQLTRHPRGDLP